MMLLRSRLMIHARSSWAHCASGWQSRLIQPLCHRRNIIATHKRIATRLDPWKSCRTFASSAIAEPIVSSSLPHERLPLHPNIDLRYYQKECSDEIIEAYKSFRRVGTSIATGGGKTVIIADVVNRVKPRKGQGDKVMIVVPKVDILDQTIRTLESIYPGKKVGREHAKHSADLDSDIIVATIQTLTTNISRLKRFDPKHFKMVVCDEVHRGVSKQYLKMWDYFGCLDPDSAIYVLGVTATMKRHDRLPLGKIMDKIIYVKSVNNLISDGHLCDVKLTIVKTDENFDQCMKVDGIGRNLHKVAKLLNTPVRNELTYKTYKHQILNAGLKCTIMFACDVQHCLDLANTLRSQGVDARVVTGSTPLKERKEIFASLNRGEFPVLVNCEVAIEGFDCPRCDSIMLCRPTYSKVLVTQMIGRALRIYPGKEYCLIIDMADVISTCDGLDIIPTLLGKKDRVFGSGEDAVEIEPKKRDFGNLVAVNPKKISFQIFDSFSEFLEFNLRRFADASIYQQPGGTDISSISRFNWLHVGSHVYILYGNKGYFKVFPEEKSAVADAIANRQVDPQAVRYLATRYLPKQKWGKRPFTIPIKVKKIFSSLVDAIKAVDDLAVSVFKPEFISRTAAWRDERTTTTQRDFIMKFIESRSTQKKFEGRVVDKDALEKLTRGQAADLISLVRLNKSDLLLPLTKLPHEGNGVVQDS